MVDNGESNMINWLKKIQNFKNPQMDLGSKIGQRVVLKSVAANGKAGALITIQEQPVYIEGMERWNESLLGRKVTVEGVLRQEVIFPQVGSSSDIPVQGMSGAAFYIEDHKLL